MSFLMLEVSWNAKFPLTCIWFISKTDPDLFYILYLACCYKTNGRSFCLVLAVGSTSDGSSAICSTIFLKMPKMNYMKIVIFRKHFSRSLISIYGLIRSFLGIFIYFSFLLSVPKTLFSIFLVHFLTPSGTNLLPKQNMGSVDQKKKQTRQHLLVFGNVSKRQYLKIVWN